MYIHVKSEKRSPSILSDPGIIAQIMITQSHVFIKAVKMGISSASNLDPMNLPLLVLQKKMIN